MPERLRPVACLVHAPNEFFLINDGSFEALCFFELGTGLRSGHDERSFFRDAATRLAAKAADYLFRLRTGKAP